MAKDRLRVLLDAQPTGPYVLGGYCNGGLVAFEMARLLLKKGMKVELLFIIDASAVNARHRWSWNSMAFLASGLRLDHDAFTDRFSRIRRMMNRWQEESREGKRDQASLVMRKIEEMHRRLFRPAESRLQSDATVSRHQDREEKFRAYRHILRGYIPGFYPGRVVLLHTDSIASRVPDDPTLG